LFTDVIGAGLGSDDFRLRDDGRICEAMIRLWEANEPIDQISVAEGLGTLRKILRSWVIWCLGWFWNAVTSASRELDHQEVAAASDSETLRGAQYAANDPGVEPLGLAFNIVTK